MQNLVTILAEKPAVAQTLAEYLGAANACEGYYEGNGFAVTWAYGHLLCLYVPGIDGPWEKTPLPILPQSFSLKVITYRNNEGKEMTDQKAEKQLEVIRNLFSRSKRIIEATDAAREGELIFREIYYYLGYNFIPVDRLWLNSLTNVAIKQAFESIRPMSEYDNLYMSALCRNEADWLVGINATRAFTLASGEKFKVLPLGRVQTPVLKMICERYEENLNFKQEKFYLNKLVLEKDGIRFEAKDSTRYFNLDEAMTKRNLSMRENAKVLFIKKETVTVQPPKLHNITSIQKEANIRFKYAASETTEFLESLYLKKNITYPRTDSRYITEDVFDTIPGLLDLLSRTGLSQQEGILKWPTSISHSPVNPDKVGDHHALLITENLPTDITSKGEYDIYCLIALRMVEAFSEEAIMEKTSGQMESGGVKYNIHGNVVIKEGWLGALKKKEKESQGENEEIENSKQEIQVLPALEEGELVKICDVDTSKNLTQPKPLLTEASLLTMMEKASSLTEDKEMKHTLRECDGIGTAATRAEIIKGLQQKELVIKEDNCFIPTEKGLIVYYSTKNKEISSVEMTARWEEILEGVANGITSADSFRTNIRKYAGDIVLELTDNNFIAKLKAAFASSKCRCPRCGAPINIDKFSAKCDSCDLKIYRTICSAVLTDTQMTELIMCGKTAEKVEGMVSKSGNRFSAFVTLTEEFKTKIIFD